MSVTEPDLVNLTPNLIRLIVKAYEINKVSYQTQLWDNAKIFNSSRYYSAVTYLRNEGIFVPCCSAPGCNRRIEANNGGVCEKNDKEHRNANKTFRCDKNTLKGEGIALLLRKK